MAGKELLALVLLFFCTLPYVEAVVAIPQYNEFYVSLPARFGGKLSEFVDEDNPPIQAYLTLVKDQPHMCSDELKNMQPRPPFVGNNNENNKANNSTIIETKEPKNAHSSTMDSSMMIDENDQDNSFVIDIADQDILPLPPPRVNLPVALLVERGECTFYEKAILASHYGPFVKYIIIYDDQVAPDLVPMSSDYETDLTLLFVSAATGRALQNHIVMASHFNYNETVLVDNEFNHQDDRFLGYNLVVAIDGTSPYFSSDFRGLNMAAYFLAAMSGFLAFLIFFGCLLICAQCGCITAAPDERGRIVLFAGGPGIRPPETLARMIRIDKLTLNQVLLLDEEEYESEHENNDENEAACCAICLEEFEPKEKVRVLPCGHKFHEDCLIPWLTERHASCPLCKMDVLKHVREIEAKLKENQNGKIESETESNKSNDDNDSAATQSSSPRSFWYRLRGWSLVDGRPPAAVLTAAIDNSTTNDSTSLSLGVSEIEMETWTVSTGSENLETAAEP